ncbi:SDR family oxidoreductase [Novosphingobium album (ex Liu et al. 2023)]|uniref:SDR family oxidoreductase n=1 Tax=Novosphingobium album (ex Liu et al. 2023) TaxID=3031130 RepID=A0ABT5WUT3_9SPHN|nr:SDR family oxidoreductase [Novosphingobium album (ex Liu et al. 2023)]MDE8653618.1 SDR family oxidoreductase [Novosphingobium album (ex Liu et al. 2023)]
MSEWMRADGVAIVTGAAGGMGRECARLLAEDGWPELLLCDLDEARLEAVAEPLRAAGATVSVLAGEVTAPEFWSALTAAVAGKGIGAMIHTAGVSPHMCGAQRLLEINLDATVMLVDAIQPLMNARGGVVLFASMASYFSISPEADAAFVGPLPDAPAARLVSLAPSSEAAYPLSKRAVRAIAQREARRFGERGARIVSMSPGFIDTPMMTDEMNPQVQHMLEQSALARLGRPAELAAVAVFLCGPRAGFVTGCDIIVDGGALAALGIPKV